MLAKGFAAAIANLSSDADTATVQLRLAAAAETVVVTATRTPVPTEAAGADVETLSGSQLETLQPVTASDAIRFLPGAVVNTAGQRGGLSSLFVRGGDSTYNKVIVDGVTINEPGGTFDFGTLPLTEADHMEFVRGAQSTLYGSDAMTSVVQVWTRTGTTATPELSFGADGGNFSTANGYASLAGAHGRFDYDLFGDQFNTSGQGVNNSYSDSLQGGNLGVAFNDQVSLRVRIRHSNSHTGVPGEWNFNGDPLEPPDPNEWSQLNDLLGSVELTVAAPSGWQHRFTGFEYNYRYNDVNLTGDPARVDDFPAHGFDDINRAGFEYQGDYLERSWARTTVGYRFEDENGFVGDLNFPPLTHGLRLNDDVYGQQQLTLGRLLVIAGARFVHNGAFGNTGVPRVALTLLALRGGEVFSGTRLRFSYATGFKEPRLEETFAGPPFSIPNTTLKPERNRAFEAGLLQNLVWKQIRVHCDLLQQSVLRPDRLCHESRDFHRAVLECGQIFRPGRGSRVSGQDPAETVLEHGLHLHIDGNSAGSGVHAGEFLRSYGAGRGPASAAPAQAFGNHFADLFRETMGSKPGGKFCGPQEGLGFPGVRH